MLISFTQLTTPNPEIAATLNKWSNDPLLIPFIRPNRSQEELEEQAVITVESLTKHLEHHSTYLIHADGQLVGEMNYCIDPTHLFKTEAGTAWIGIVFGEETARGKGLGGQAMRYLEEQIQAKGLKRIELGVFAFNTRAHKLYLKLGYHEIGRLEDFTYWQGKMWQDIRMEKNIK
ncbi:GNAT family N-acetyltransferase [Chloroflexota bacterium]